jgi:hypothetical protein
MRLSHLLRAGCNEEVLFRGQVEQRGIGPPALSNNALSVPEMDRFLAFRDIRAGAIDER